MSDEIDALTTISAAKTKITIDVLGNVHGTARALEDRKVSVVRNTPNCVAKSIDGPKQEVPELSDT